MREETCEQKKEGRCKQKKECGRIDTVSAIAYNARIDTVSDDSCTQSGGNEDDQRDPCVDRGKKRRDRKCL